MNLFDRIKQLKLIEPDRAYSERSRREILATEPSVFLFKRMSPWQIFVRVIETGVAAGLVALFIFIMTGGVATGPLAPVPFAAVSPEALHAEAQAIDMQIKLANLVYDASRAPGAISQSTAISNFSASQAALFAGAMTSTPAMASATSTATSSSASATSSLSVDEALQALSQ